MELEPMEFEPLPRGGVTERKYAVIMLALAMARGALSESESSAYAKRILDLTGTARIAEALGCREAELAIHWDNHLSPEEIDRIEGRA